MSTYPIAINMDKPQVFFLDNHVMVLSGGRQPAPHAHLTDQLIVSLDGAAQWEVGGSHFTAQALYIDGGVAHFSPTPGRYLSLLFIKTSRYARSAQMRLLKGEPYAVLPDENLRPLGDLVKIHAENPALLSELLLRACGVPADAAPDLDPRIRRALQTLEGMDCVPAEAPRLLSKEAFLSQSRFSHLFKQQTGMSLAGYLAFQKLRKTCLGLRSGKAITQACLDAGFSTPSHCAATCTKMFGLPLRGISFS